jgi:hypothetical protein
VGIRAEVEIVESWDSEDRGQGRVTHITSYLSKKGNPEISGLYKGREGPWLIP